MRTATIVFAFMILGSGLEATAQQESSGKPKELKWIQGSVGVWDASIEVWPQGPDGASIKFKGVETNKAYGEYWISSDFDSSFMGQEQKIHSIVGYDLDKKKLVGTIVDAGPYAATMTGEFVEKDNAVKWVTQAKGLDGKPMVQNTVLTNKSATERELVMLVPGKEGKFNTFMRIVFTKRDAKK